MKSAKNIVKEIFYTFGLEISRARPDTHPTRAKALGSNHLSDIRSLTRSHPQMVFDVGANIGQSVVILRA